MALSSLANELASRVFHQAPRCAGPKRYRIPANGAPQAATVTESRRSVCGRSDGLDRDVGCVSSQRAQVGNIPGEDGTPGLGTGNHDGVDC
jgi:hypothetical protein